MYRVQCIPRASPIVDRRHAPAAAGMITSTFLRGEDPQWPPLGCIHLSSSSVVLHSHEDLPLPLLGPSFRIRPLVKQHRVELDGARPGRRRMNNAVWSHALAEFSTIGMLILFHYSRQCQTYSFPPASPPPSHDLRPRVGSIFRCSSHGIDAPHIHFQKATRGRPLHEFTFP